MDHLNRWGAVEIAAGATCLAAIVAAVGSFVVAAVNTWSARKLARETARREFRLTVARPYLEFVDRLLNLHRDFVAAGPGTAASVSKAAALLAASELVLLCHKIILFPDGRTRGRVANRRRECAPGAISSWQTRRGCGAQGAAEPRGL
jgi:hypothetical protein